MATEERTATTAGSVQQAPQSEVLTHIHQQVAERMGVFYTAFRMERPVGRTVPVSSTQNKVAAG